MTHVTGFGAIGKVGHLNRATGWTAGLPGSCATSLLSARFSAQPQAPSLASGLKSLEEACRLLAVRCRSSPELSAHRIISPPHRVQRVAGDVGQGDCAIRRGFTKTGVGG